MADKITKLINFYRSIGAPDIVAYKLAGDLKSIFKNKYKINPALTLPESVRRLNLSTEEVNKWFSNVVSQEYPEDEQYYEYIEPQQFEWNQTPLQTETVPKWETNNVLPVFVINSFNDVSKLINSETPIEYFEYSDKFENSLNLKNMITFLKENDLLRKIETKSEDDLSQETYDKLSRFLRGKKMYVDQLLDDISNLKPIMNDLDESLLREVIKTPINNHMFKEYVDNAIKSHTEGGSTKLEIDFIIIDKQNRKNSKTFTCDVPNEYIDNDGLTNNGIGYVKSLVTGKKGDLEGVPEDYITINGLRVSGGSNNDGTCLLDSIEAFLETLNLYPDLTYLEGITEMTQAYNLVKEHENIELPFINDLGILLKPCHQKYKNRILYLMSHFELVDENYSEKTTCVVNVEENEKYDYTELLLDTLKDSKNIVNIRRIKGITEFNKNDIAALFCPCDDNWWLQYDIREIIDKNEQKFNSDEFKTQLTQRVSEWLESYEYYSEMQGWTRYQFITNDSAIDLVKAIHLYNNNGKEIQNKFHPYCYRNRYCRNKILGTEAKEYYSIDGNKAYFNAMAHVLRQGKIPIFYNIGMDPRRLDTLTEDEKRSCCCLCMPKKNYVMPCGYYSYENYKKCEKYLDIYEVYPLQQEANIKIYFKGDTSFTIVDDYLKMVLDVKNKDRYKKLIGSMICKNSNTRVINWLLPTHYNNQMFTHLSADNYNFKTVNTYIHPNIIMRFNEVMSTAIKFFYEECGDMLESECFIYNGIETVRALHTDAIILNPWKTDNNCEISYSYDDVTIALNNYIFKELGFKDAFKAETPKMLTNKDNNHEDLLFYYNKPCIEAKFGVAGCGKTYSIRNKNAERIDKACVIVNNYYLRNNVWLDFNNDEHKYPVFIYQQIIQNYTQLFDYETFIVDECFKLNNDEINNILNIANANNVKTIMLGDYNQFKPVTLGLHNTQYLAYIQHVFEYGTMRNDFSSINKVMCEWISNNITIEMLKLKKYIGYENANTLIHNLLYRLPIKFFTADDVDLINNDNEKLRFCHYHEDDNAISQVYKGDLYRCVKTVNNVKNPEKSFIRNVFYTKDDLKGIENVKITTMGKLNVYQYKGSAFVHSGINKLHSIQGMTIREGETLYLYGTAKQFYISLEKDTRLLYVVLTRFALNKRQILTSELNEIGKLNLGDKLKYL